MDLLHACALALLVPPAATVLWALIGIALAAVSAATWRRGQRRVARRGQ